jgi:hypothetical protein
MDDLTKKRFAQFDYTSRYTGIPYYYNKKDQREIYGLSRNMIKNSSWVAHKVAQDDTLDKLALNYYNNPSYWWVIAYFNDIQDAFIRLKDYFDVIKIPSINSIEFGDLR